MKAATFDTFGSPDVITVRDIPPTPLTSTSVRVRVSAVAVNHVDTYIRSGAYRTPLTQPAVVGRDFVGEIAEVGPAVSSLAPGQWVWGNSAGYEGRPGATSEYVVADESRVYPVPDGVDPHALVAAVHPGATAAIVLADIMRAQSGERIFVQGAAGHVGRKFTELAVRMGLEVTTSSSPRDFDYLAGLGATRTLDYHDEVDDDLGDYFDHLVDTSGKSELEANLALLRTHGEVTLITAPKSNEFTFRVREMYMSSKRINGFVISHANVEQLAKAAGVLNEAFARGQLLSGEVLLRPMADAAWAHTALESGEHPRERIVLTLN